MAGGRPPDPLDEHAEPLWAVRVLELSARLHPDAVNGDRALLRERLWVLLAAGLAQLTRAQAPRLGALTREDREDLVAIKAMELMERIESGALVFRPDAPAELRAFLARTVRNGMIDLLRRQGRWRTENHEEDQAESPSVDGALVDGVRATDPSNRVELRELADGVEACLAGLAPRARRIWILRAFLDLSSKEIAQHPDVRLDPRYVDVILGRVRQALRTCLTRRGFDLTQARPTGFARLWDRFVRETSGERKS